ncbi:MAG: tRNA pseudouridine(38-40) synthase TruA [Bacteroidetes bacterium]|nr:tRNA pseudouridine(38-40) synthase TruA [Bacteroidota bacterium]
MARFKLTIEYEGTRFSGWQVQKNARTVQGEINAAVGKVFGTHNFELYGSGRTDAGVHALQQAAHLDIKTMLAPEIIRMKLNDELPADINIIEVEKAAADFHARHDAQARSYLYQISRRRTAFGKKFVWWVKDPLDVVKMRQTADLFKGLKDFRSFTADDPEEKSTKVHINSIEVQESGDLILVRIVGSHFIWKMVRQLIGVLAEVGRGSMPVNEVKKFMHTKSDVPAKMTAPPSGLFLERVYYKGDVWLKELKPMMDVSAKPAARFEKRHEKKSAGNEEKQSEKKE